MDGKLTEELMKMASESSASDNTIVQDTVREILSGDSEEAGIKIASLDEDQMDELRAELKKHGGGPEMPTHGTVENPKAEVRKEVPETKPSTEARPAKERVDINLGKGLGPGDGGSSNPPGSAPTIATLLSPPTKDTTRTPEGGGDTAEDLKKKAEFESGWVEGIKMGVEEITKLAAKYGRLNLSQRFGEVFDKIAAQVGEEAATTALLESFAEGQKLAMHELETEEEVKMGSLRELAQDQEKVASLGDMRAYGRRLGREALLTKIAEDQMIAEAPAAVEGEADPEIAEAAEAAEIIDAIAQKAIDAPETLEPEEAEVLLEVADAVEDAEAEVAGGEEHVASVLDIAAALRRNGYGE